MKKLTSSPKRRIRKTSSVKTAIRRRKRSRSGLSELFSPTTAKNSIKSTIAAFGGGLLARKASQLATTVTGGNNPLMMQLLLAGVGGLVMHSVLNSPNLSSGFVGGVAALNSQQLGLGEDEVSFADDDSLEEEPLFLDEDGNEMMLNEFDEFEYVD
jgi:hypothetical protein